MGTANTLSVCDGEMATLSFLAMLVWPLLDLYWLIAVSLKQLLPGKIRSQREFAELCAKFAAQLYYAGDIDFFECVGIHSINNALRWFQTQRILTAQSVQIGKSTFLTQSRGTTVSVFQLTASYRNKEALEELAKMIATYRKPTKGQKRIPRHSAPSKL